jgi:hypothetical protein
MAIALNISIFVAFFSLLFLAIQTLFFFLLSWIREAMLHS